MSWPKETVIWLHGSKESNYDHGKKLGLRGEPLNLFMFACYEVGIRVRVHDDGKAEIIGIKEPS